MTGLARLLIFVMLASLSACGPEVKKPAPATSQAAPTTQATPASPPPASQPSAPAQAPAPRPAPAPPAPVVAPPPPATAAPAPREAPPKAVADAPQHLIVSVAKANMREKPDAKAKILHVLTKGMKLVVVSKGNQWYRVRMTNGAEGWIAESVVKPARPD